MGLRYPTKTPEMVVRAWSDAFNRGDVDQLRRLVHPSRLVEFEAHGSDVDAQIRQYDIDRYAVGDPVEPVEGLEARSVTFWFHDGARTLENPAVIVQQGERWWVWRY